MVEALGLGVVSRGVRQSITLRAFSGLIVGSGLSH